MTERADGGAGSAVAAERAVDDMSPSPGDTPPAVGRPRATALSVFWALIVLGLVLAGFGNLGRPAPPPLEATQVLDELFARADLPAGFEATGARRLPGGETLVTLLPADASENDVVELRLVRYPRVRAKDVLESQFQRLRFESPDDRRWRGGGGWGEDDSGPKLQDAGTLTWHGYEARFARLRHSLEGADGDEGDEGDDSDRGERGESRL